MLKKIFVVLFSVCWASCSGDKYGIKDHHHHNHHDLYYGGGLLYYLTFLAIKVKIAFVIGAIIIMVLFFGKLWALVTYSKYMIGDTKKSEPEKVYIQAPSHHHAEEFYDHHSGSESMNSYVYKRPKQNTYNTINRNKQYAISPPPGHLQRSLEHTIYNDLNTVAKFMNKLNATEGIFKSETQTTV